LSNARVLGRRGHHGGGFIVCEGLAARGGGVDNTGHAVLAVGGSATVEPDWVCVFDGYLEDLTLWELSEKIHRGVDFSERTELQEGRGDGKGRAYSAVEVVVDAAREEAIAD
jgi:hypothetical protein